MSNTSDSGIRCYNNRVPLKYYRKSKTDQMQTIYNKVNKLLPRIMMDKKIRSEKPEHYTDLQIRSKKTAIADGCQQGARK